MFLLRSLSTAGCVAAIGVTNKKKQLTAEKICSWWCQHIGSLAAEQQVVAKAPRTCSSDWSRCSSELTHLPFANWTGHLRLFTIFLKRGAWSCTCDGVSSAWPEPAIVCQRVLLPPVAVGHSSQLQLVSVARQEIQSLISRTHLQPSVFGNSRRKPQNKMTEERLLHQASLFVIWCQSHHLCCHNQSSSLSTSSPLVTPSV